MTPPSFILDATGLAKLDQVVAIKQPPTIIKQTPAAGTPVVAGMTIEVQAISFSDVQVGALVADAPAAIRGVPLATLDDFVAGDPTILNVVNTGKVAAADRGMVAEKINAALTGKGLTGTVSADDTDAIIGAIAGIGSFRS
jgi:hypothetical protein